MHNLTPPQHIILLAGEKSGDLYGALLAQRLLSINPTIRLSGIGGNAMQKAGVQLWENTTCHSVMGFVEVFRSIRYWLKLRKKVIRHIIAERPDAIILIDFPDFNLSVARLIKKTLGERSPFIFYFIPPQVWIWRKKRIHRIAKLCHTVYPLFSFENDLYQSRGIRSRYFGHPIRDMLSAGKYPQNPHQKQDNHITLGLLPGSRNQEVVRILPIMLQSILLYSQRSRQPLHLYISRVGEVDASIYETIHRRFPTLNITWCRTSDEVITHSDAVLAKSGTVNLELIYHRKASLIVYRTGTLTYLIARAWLRIRHISLINILARNTVVREFIQHHARPESIAQEIEQLLLNDAYRHHMLDELDKLCASLFPESECTSVVNQIAADMLRIISR